MDLITYALCKNLGASAASDAASSASAAQAAQDAAETARAGAESAQSAAVTAQGLAEDAQDAAETARNAAQSAQSAAESAKSGAEAAKSGAETAKTAAETAAGNASDHAEAAASSASAAAQSAQAAQEAAQTALGIIDDEAVAADSTWSSDKISAEIETISPDDSSVGDKPWSSKQIIDALCPPLEETGNPVQCYPVAGYPLGVKASWEPRQEGEGDPSPENVRPITGLDEVHVAHCGRNLYDADALRIIDNPAETYGFGVPADNLVIGKTYTISVNSPVFSLKISDYKSGYSSVNDANVTDGKATFVMARNSNIPNGETQYVMVSDSSDIGDLVSTPEQAKSLQISICAGEDAMPYEPYTGTTATLTLPKTIYGGTVDAVTGVGSAQYIYRELAISDMDNTEDFPGWNNVPWINDVKHNPAPDGDFAALGIYGATNVADISQRYFWNSRGTHVYTLPEFWGGKTQSQIKEAYPDLVVQFCFRLVTPTPFQATGAQSLPTLSGQNVLITNADSLTVTGRADPNHTIQTLSDRIAALESETIEGGTNA